MKALCWVGKSKVEIESVDDPRILNPHDAIIKVTRTGITMKMGQTNMHTYMKPLLDRIEEGQIDPSYIISHRISLEEAPEMYKVWRDKKENVTKIVIDPWAEKMAA
jgi:threonine dehydrogenase-like Zn-dependent dehydrogenase